MDKLVESLQTDLPTRLYRVTSGFNESLYLAANEPSLGMYRIQEHIQANIPKVVEHKLHLQEVARKVEGACFDVEYACEAVSEMSSISNFSNIAASLDRAILCAQKLQSQYTESQSQGKASPRNYGSIQHTERTLPILSTAEPTRNTGLDIRPKSFD